jgi:transposase
MDKRWAQAPGRREQLALFTECLDDSLPAEHPIRALDACLARMDWTSWEKPYDGMRGQPPIHPRLVAGCILYGLMRGLRSSRALEDATRERLDFIWFLERRTIDHATFAQFRTQFGEALKDLNRQLARMICMQYEQALLTLVIDGTRIRANSNRHGARTAAGLERLIGACVTELDRKLAQLAEEDTTALELERCRLEIEALQAKIALYERAHTVAQERDLEKKSKDGAGAHAVRVPVTDPDAQITPNKEGGFAPNYTPTVAVDGASGIIVSADVLCGSDEASAVLPAVAAAQDVGNVQPARILADSGFASGENLDSLAQHGIEAYMPTTTDFRQSNPANRCEPAQPVAPCDWGRLPQRGGQLAASAFVYDATTDQYHCPMGKTLTRVRRGVYKRTGIAFTQYQCPGKAGCPLADRCVKAKAAARTIVRDQHQTIRDHVGRRMATPEGCAIYKSRAPLVEGVFAGIKHGMGIRRFLVRGLDKVRTEWQWICTAFNLKKQLRSLRQPRPTTTPLIPAQ